MIGLCVSLIIDNFSSFIGEINKKEILLSFNQVGSLHRERRLVSYEENKTFSFCFLPGDPGWPQMFKVDIDSAAR